MKKVHSNCVYQDLCFYKKKSNILVFIDVKFRHSIFAEDATAFTQKYVVQRVQVAHSV